MLLQFILSYEAIAQIPTQTIRGNIADENSQLPIVGATVFLLNTQYGCHSDSAGNFVMTNIPTGRYDIRISMTGYTTYLVREIEVGSGKELVFSFYLKEKLNTLSNVVIKQQVNKEQALNTMATLSATMLSVEEAKRYAGGFDDPARLVSAFAGVSSNVNNNAISIRGNNPQAFQWKLEGIEIPNPNHFADMSAFGGGGITALSAQLLANSDFFSGAMPAEYNNALSGVFDIFMRKGNNKNREQTIQIGLLGIDVASEGPFKKGKNASYLFNYRYSTLSLLAPVLPENAGGTNYQDLSFKINFPNTKTGTYTLWGIGLLDHSGAEAKTDTSLWKYESDSENQDVQQYMGAIGLSHKYSINRKQYLKSTFATTCQGINLNTEQLDYTLHTTPKNKITQNNYSMVLSSFIHTKFNTRHSNKTGINITNLMYDMHLQEAAQASTSLSTIVSEKGNTQFIALYSNSSFQFSEKLNANIGINAQLLMLNKNFNIEPRIGFKYQLNSRQQISFAYGLHSRMERLNYYFGLDSNKQYINRNLDFTKSHHLILAYNLNLSEFIHVKVEAYYQYLFNVPVINDSSFSILNNQNNWFFNEALVNKGNGKNYGIELSIEKYLSKGYYYLITASMFNSFYKGGDEVWRHTRYNRNFALNALVGKEWMMGRNRKNTFGINIRFCYQGGDHHSPIHENMSQNMQSVYFNENQAYSLQLSPSFTGHFTTSYRINKMKSSHEIALKFLNFTQYQEFIGFQYNFKTQQVDEIREAIFIPNLSYKIEF